MVTPVTAKRTPVILEEVVPTPDKKPAKKKTVLLEKRDPELFEKAVIEYVLGLNEQVVKKYVYPDKPTQRDKKDQLQNLLAQMQVDNRFRDQLNQVFSILFGEDIDWRNAKNPSEEGITLLPGQVWIPLNNNNGNNYPIGQPMLAIQASWPTVRGIMMNGSPGNNLDAQEGNARIATRDEVVNLVKTLGAKKIAKVLGLIIIG
jgi:hypothetical protein